MNIWIVGDIWLTNSPENAKEDNFWSNLLDEPCQDSVLIANFEGNLSTGKPHPNKYVILDADSALLKAFKPFKQVIFSLANNHIADRGREGVIETKQCLENFNFLTVGAGRNLQEARKPLILKLHSQKLAILSYCDTKEISSGVAATERSPGVAPLIPELIVDDICSAKAACDQVWLMIHWGKEYYRFPVPEMCRWAKNWAEAGASLIIGTHPHNLQGIEKFNNSYIFYSLGNFIFPESTSQSGFPTHFDRICRRTMAISVKSNNMEIQTKNFIIGDDGWPRIPSAKEDYECKQYLEYVSSKLGKGYDLFYQGISKKEKLFRYTRRFRSMSWREIVHRAIRLGRLKCAD